MSSSPAHPAGMLDRVRTALQSLHSRAIEPSVVVAIRALDAPAALVLGGDPGALGGSSVAASDEQLEVLAGLDEAAACAGLLASGVGAVVVARRLGEALDRDATVLSRLVRHDDLEWFQLQLATASTLVYSPRRSPMRLAAGVGEALLASLRARLAGRRSTPVSLPFASVRVLATMRLQGRALVVRHAVGAGVEEVLDDVAEKLAQRWDREWTRRGVGTLDAMLPRARLQLLVVFERARVEAERWEEVEGVWSPGIDGVMLAEGDAGTTLRGYLPGSEASTRAVTRLGPFVEAALEACGGGREAAGVVTGVSFIRGEEYLEQRVGGGAAIRLVRGIPEHNGPVDRQGARRMLRGAADWWSTNMRPDGSVLYKYWPETHRTSNEYNEVRHILAARDLSDAARILGKKRYLEDARRAMDWLLQGEVKAGDPAHPSLPSPQEGMVLFRFAGNQKLGTVAVALLGWIAWARATGSRTEDERIRAMARFVASRQDASGAFDPYFVNAGHPAFGARNDIVPGEAALALGLVAEYFAEPTWAAFFPKFLDWYEPWFRTRAAQRRVEGRWPHGIFSDETRLDLVQFAPWAIMACAQIVRLQGDARAGAFGLEIADWMMDSYQWTHGRAPFRDFVGGYFKRDGELPAMQTFCYSEGVAAAWGIAKRMAPAQAGRYERSLLDSLGFLRRMQFDEVAAYFAPVPARVLGGVRYALNEPKVRIDYVGHATSTLVQYLDTAG